jgi:hypothetical protein
MTTASGQEPGGLAAAGWGLEPGPILVLHGTGGGTVGGSKANFTGGNGSSWTGGEAPPSRPLP